MIVCKFGGTSMATAASIRQVARIVKEDRRRKLCVVSAPGRTEDLPKVTDLLLERRWDEVRARFRSLIRELGLGEDSHRHLAREFDRYAKNPHAPTSVSFGERMSAHLLSKVLKWRYVDAADIIHFSRNGVYVYSPEHLPAVVPGFYGFDTTRRSIALFPRGGSDISGAHLAAACNATVYENWTDVSGVYDKDPLTDISATPYAHLSYEELVTVSRGGAQVFHAEAVMPVAERGIPIHIKNTFAPDDPGTIVHRSS